MIRMQPVENVLRISNSRKKSLICKEPIEDRTDLTYTMLTNSEIGNSL
jgi:hypothetical protein